jgi:hypothetical protein
MVRLKLHRHCLRERKRVSWVVHLYHKNWAGSTFSANYKMCEYA